MKRQKVCFVIIITFVLIFLTLQKGHSIDWDRATIDAGSISAGRTSALGIDNNGYPHIVYYFPYQVRYAYQDNNSSWHIEVITSSNLGNFDRFSVDFDSKNQIHISFHHHDVNNYEALKYTFKDNLGWHTETVDRGYIYFTTIRIDKNDFPHIVYYMTDYSLKYAYKDNTGWHIQTIAADVNAGIYNARFFTHKIFDLDKNDRPCVAYYKFSDNNSDLVFSWLEGSTWQYETIVTNLGDQAGRYAGASIEIDNNNNAHIVYNTKNNKAIDYAYQDMAGWHLHRIVSIQGNYAAYPSLDIDNQNYPHISFYDNGPIIYIFKDANGWSRETVSSSGENCGAISSIALNENDEPHISYDGNKLRFARPQDYGPNPFSLISPLDGNSTSPQPTFRWQASSYNGNGLTCHELWIDDALIKANIPPYQVTTTVENPLSFGWHNWKVRAVLSAGGEIWSNEVWSFLVSDPYDLGFRPNPNGFNFQNHGTVSYRDLEMFEHYFGKDAVRNKFGLIRLAALEFWWNDYHTLTPNGSCVGMSVASLISYFCDSIDQSFVTSKYSMLKYERLFDQKITTQMERSIAYYHGCQSSKHIKLIDRIKDPNSLFIKIENSIRLNNHGILVFEDLVKNPDRGAHAVLPYKAQRSPDSLSGKIWVYDCNRDWIGNNDKYFLFDFVNNSWSYEYENGEVWQGYAGHSQTWFKPIKHFTKQGIPLWDQKDVPETLFDFVKGKGWRKEALHLLFKADNGLRLGKDLAGRIYDEIIGAFRIVEAGTQAEPESEKYMLPSHLIYDVTVYGLESGKMNFDVMADGYWLAIKNASITSNSVDYIKYSKDGRTLIYSTNDESKTYSILFDLELEDVSREFLFNNTTLSNNDTSKFKIINDLSIQYTNTGSTKSYDLALVQVAQDSIAFSFKNITISSNESHIITPHDWEKLDSTNILLEIDRGNDGTIDSSVILNQYVGVESDESSAKITNFSLSQNYPNPFNSETTIKYQLPTSCHVVIAIYNTIGQEIKTLINGEQQAGYHQIAWDGKDNSGRQVGTGIYLYQLKSNDFIAVKKMIMIE